MPCPDHSKDSCAKEIPAHVRVAVYGVFDGHAGARAALHCERELLATFASKIPKGLVRHC